MLLYWLLTQCWGRDAVAATRWKRFFEGNVERSRFEWYLKTFDRSSLDDELCQSFGEAIETAIGPGGGRLRDELEACVDDFNYLRDKPSNQLSSRRNRLIGRLRQLVSRAAVHHLEPDLVILDEFQRFKDLLDADDEGAELAHAIFDHPDAKVLLLSATPYKMYTLPDEPEGDDHYRDFIRTVRFLADDERAHIVERELRKMRESLFSGGDHAPAVEAKGSWSESFAASCAERNVCRRLRTGTGCWNRGRCRERGWQRRTCGPGRRSTTSHGTSIGTMSSSTGARRHIR